MENIWVSIGSVLLIFTFAIVSPGPNFILVLNRSLTDSRRIGVYSALGVATGSGLFAVAGLLGLIMLINTMPYFATITRYVGGAYLVYLGGSMLITCRTSFATTLANPQADAMQPVAAYGSGLLTNLTNPKAWAFYLSLFTLVIENEFPLWAKAFLAISMFLISFCWYGLMALLVSDQRIQGRFFAIQPYVKSILGLLLTLLGGRLLLRG